MKEFVDKNIFGKLNNYKSHEDFCDCKSAFLYLLGDEIDIRGKILIKIKLGDNAQVKMAKFYVKGSKEWQNLKGSDKTLVLQVFKGEIGDEFSDYLIDNYGIKL